MDSRIRNTIENHISVLNAIKNDESLLKSISDACTLIVDCFKSGGKVLICGNGGSAADAEHIAAELSGKFNKDRAALFAEALHVNTAALTAIANDYGYNMVFKRMLEAKATNGDVLIALSTSGRSSNVIEAIRFAQHKACGTIGICGADNAQIKPYSDHLISIPSESTPRIQEAYMLVAHIICEEVENQLFPDV